MDEEAFYVAEFLEGQVTRLDLHDDETRRRVVARMLVGPLGVVTSGGRLYVAESLGQRISVVDLVTGRQDVLVAAGIGRPTAMDLDADGGLLVIDGHGKRLVKVDRETGVMTVLADRLPVYPILASNWPLVGIPNGLAVNERGQIFVGGNDDGSVWRLERA